MSARTIRKQNAGVIAQRLARVEREREATAREKEALDLAHRVLLEEPKSVIPCNFVLEFVPFNAVTDRGHCSECGGAPIGFTEYWKWCPLCGAQIAEVQKESNPHDRNIRERVESALKPLMESID
jgi:hypothetical protein